MKEHLNNLQYNSCISKGICSINPRTSALENVLVLYLHLCSKYCLKLYQKNVLDESIKKCIINTTAISILNPEFTEECFMMAISDMKEIILSVIKTYNEVYDETDFIGENLKDSEIFKKCENITDTIKFGETIFNESVSNISSEVRNMFKIILIVAKSISINILDLKSFEEESSDDFVVMLNLINAINPNNSDITELKNIIYEGAECNDQLMTKLHNAQEKRYGKQTIKRVSYTTTPAKAVLVVGSNIRELEMVLEELKDKDIDVYTHDDMMVAHTFPKFNEYKNLKGQYGYGVENCLIDFGRTRRSLF